MNRRTRPQVSKLAMVMMIVAIFLCGESQTLSAQNEGFKTYKLVVYCGNSGVASVIFSHEATTGGTVGRPLMGTHVESVGNCPGCGTPVSLADALARLPRAVSTTLKAMVDTHQADAAAGTGRPLTCLGEGKKPPASKCDKKKACEAIDAIHKAMAKYNDALGSLPGSFAELNAELGKLMQQLSDAMACRYNEGHDAADAKILNDFIGQLLKDRNSFSTLNSTAKVPQPISCDSDLGNPGSAQCGDYRTLQRIKENLSRFADLLGCSGPSQARAPAKDCTELANGVLDGLTTFFDELDKRKLKNQFGSGDAYDQVADGIEGALKELEDAAKAIEGTGGTGAQQYQDLQGKIGKLRKLLDIWGKIKAASCLPANIEALLRQLAGEKRSGREHQATCSLLCSESAKWYTQLTGLNSKLFFEACFARC